jgi:hypothetical protein
MSGAIPPDSQRQTTSTGISMHTVVCSHCSLTIMSCGRSILMIDPNFTYWSQVPAGVQGLAAGYPWPKESQVRLYCFLYIITVAHAHIRPVANGLHS